MHTAPTDVRIPSNKPIVVNRPKKISKKPASRKYKALNFR